MNLLDKITTLKSLFGSQLVYILSPSPTNHCALVEINNGRFVPETLKSSRSKKNLTSETLKPSGIKTGRKNEDDLTEENEIFLKKAGFYFPKTPYPRSPPHEHRVLS